MRFLPLLALFSMVSTCPLAAADEAASLPNVLILYADDMGFGDASCYNPESKITTPNIDRLAREGMRFVDGHSSSGICTPSRYALLTGRYHWRKFHDIVGALGASRFDAERLTLPEMLQQKGYDTACVGKWHLGWDWNAIRHPNAKKTTAAGGKQKYWGYDAFDWSKPVPDGPLAHGFDYYFGDTVINFPPYAWIENDRLISPPDANLEITAKTKEGNWEARPGPARSDWDFYDDLPTLTNKAVSWLASRKDQTKPFFLYFALPSPHAPIIPIDKFDNASQAGAYGDYVVQSDWSCGELLKTLDKIGLAENTIVVFTSDNGPEIYCYAREERFGHRSNNPLRGIKRDIYEGGHHVPFIVRWPGRVPADTTNEALISQIDVMATLAEVVGFDLPDGAAEDSYSQLSMLEGGSPVRTTLVHNTYRDRYALRDGKWLWINAPNGYHRPANKAWEARHDYPSDDHPQQLFDLSTDLGQRHNVVDSHEDIAQRMAAQLQQIREAGHSAPRLDDANQAGG
ncbi:sulfatase family protein [Aeoliella mucimassa]|nr:arylsulfatase [Aeoliella mucimassa]